MNAGWGNYAFAVLMLLTWPLWKPPSHDMMACRDWKPIDRELGPCPTTERIHAKRLEEFRKQHAQ